MDDATQALSSIVESTPIYLAIIDWLDTHSHSQKALKAYTDTIQQYRGELRIIKHDLIAIFAP